MLTTKLLLSRYDGAGNDFYVLDYSGVHVADEQARAARFPQWARELCDRKAEGGGADGLLVISPPVVEGTDARLEIYNADGSVAEMCGNGARCAAWHWFSRGAMPSVGRQMIFDTLAGLIHARVVSTGNPARIQLNIGVPVREWAALGVQSNPADHSDGGDRSSLEPVILPIDGEPWGWYGASLGNPHVVHLVDSVAAVDLKRIGPAIEKNPYFTRGTNVHVMELIDHHTVRVRHWERGSGETLACGTGAVACAVVAISLGVAASPVVVLVPGGELSVEWDGDEAFLEGPVVTHGSREFAL